MEWNDCLLKNKIKASPSSVLFHSSPASLSFSPFIVIQDTSSVLYHRGHKNFYPFPHLFILLDSFPHSFFFVQLFLFLFFFLVNCVFHRGTPPCLIFFPPPPRCIITCAALPSSLSSSSGQWQTGFIALITPQRSLLLLLCLSSSYLLTTAVPSSPHSRSSLSSVSPLWLLPFFAHLLYIRIILHVLSSKRLVPPLLITPRPSLPAHSAGPSVPTLPLNFLLKIKKKRKRCILAARCPWQKYTSILFRSWDFKCFIGKC